MSLVNLSDVKESTYGVIPEGEHTVACIAAEVKSTRDGDGEYIKCQFKVVDGQYEGRLVFHNFNIVNKSEKAVEIGKQQLKGFLTASGAKNTTALEKVDNLLGLKAVAMIKVKKSDEYDDSNEIKYFRTNKTPTATTTKRPPDLEQLPF